MSRKRGSKHKKIKSVIDNGSMLDDGTEIYPDLSMIQCDYKQTEAVCSFCQLPANFIHELGDLYGPYYPTVDEVINFHDDDTSNKDTSLSNLQLYECPSAKIVIDVNKRQCLIPVSQTNNKHGIEYTNSNLDSMKSLQKDIIMKSHRLRLYQAVDSILSHKSLRNGKPHIAGFTGKIKVIGELKSNDVLVEVVDTIIFYDIHQSVNHVMGFPTETNSSTSFENIEENDKNNQTFVKKISLEKLWTHVHCALWAPGVYCVKTQLVGMYSAVNHSKCGICKYCGKNGATISQFGNKSDVYHYLCAIICGIDFQSQSFLNEN